jgi:uncharacterized protein (TIGR03435 family)
VRRILILLVAIAGLVDVARVPARAQSAAKPLAFEVASLKERPNVPVGMIGIQRFTGRLVDTCADLNQFLFYAYHLTSQSPIGGLPDWASAACGDGISRANTYEFQATMPPDTTEDQTRQMMQTFLADRFKLAVHWETKTVPIYALVIGSSGFKLKPSDPKGEPARAPGSLGCPVEDRGCRFMGLGTVSPSQLAASVGRNLGRQVIDRTGLEGTYYFGDPKWAGDTSPDSPLPSLPTLLKERYGLELKSDTGPVDTLVIDHAEKPTGN